MTRQENILTLNEHLEHWKRLLSEKICDQSEGEKTIDALQNAIKALEQQPCDDVVSRRAVYEIINDAYFLKLDDGAALQESIHQLPSVKPQPKMGKWEWIFDVSEETPVSPEEIEYAGWGCSICHNPPDDICDWDDPNDPPTHKYCPNCGCAMKGELE